ncbi:MAG: tetratricopeptide repeat protein [Pseudomonadales bacterium]|nr:tetratricopeptide repeat protein [Pseudomonadales bacterium]
MADQRDPRLDELFQAMSQTDNARVSAEIEQQIWQIWLEHQDPEIEARLSQGMLAMDQNPARALNVFTALIEEQPEFAEAWNKRATLYYLLGDYSASADDIEQTLALEPRHFGALSGLGLVRLALNQYLEAQDAFEAVLEIQPSNRNAQQNLEMINRYLRRFTT